MLIQPRSIYRLSLVLLFGIALQACQIAEEPNYLFDVGRQIKKEKSPEQRQLDSLLLQLSNDIIELPAPEREVTGRRLLGVSRTYLKRLSYLSYAYQLTGDKRFAQKSEELLLKAASFKDWNPSHFLDVSEMTLAMAIGLNWNQKALSGETKSTIRQAIITKGLQPSIEKEWSWLTAKHNWNQVCNGGLTVGAMAVYDDAPELANQIIDRAKESIRLPEAVYEPDGVYPEGSGYWTYGTAYHVIYLAAYRHFFPNESPTLSDAFLKSSEFMLHVNGPTGPFNFSDNTGSARLSMPLFWMARQTQDVRVLHYQLQAVDRLLAGETKISPTGSGHRFFPFLLLFMSQDMFTQPLNMESLRTSWSGSGDNPVSFHRSGWGAMETYVGIKAGSPSVNHGHMDVGSFVLDTKGERWVLDLGMHNYHRLESQGVDLWNRKQNSQRWEIFRYNNLGHSTLVVDGQLQHVTGKVGLMEVVSNAERQATTMDLSVMYPSLAAAIRTVSLEADGSVVVTDRVKNDDQYSVVRWAFPTRATIGISGQVATLSQGAQQIKVEIIGPDVEWKTYSAQPNNLFEDANPGVTMLGFETELAPNALEELQVEFNQLTAEEESI